MKNLKNNFENALWFLSKDIILFWLPEILLSCHFSNITSSTQIGLCIRKRCKKRQIIKSINPWNDIKFISIFPFLPFISYDAIEFHFMIPLSGMEYKRSLTLATLHVRRHQMSNFPVHPVEMDLILIWNLKRFLHFLPNSMQTNLNSASNMMWLKWRSTSGC